MKKTLTSNSLKIIAIIAMVLDHIGILMQYNKVVYVLFRMIGRICAPIMFYSLSKGYVFTKNKFRYGLNLLLFAIISQVPYSLFNSDLFFNYKNYNVIFALFLGFMCLLIVDKIRLKLIKYSLVVLCFTLSVFCDYAFIGIAFVLLFYMLRNSKYKYLIYNIMSVIYILIHLAIYRNLMILLIMLGLFLVTPLIYFDNGQKGKYNLKYLFYFFYPIHFIILFIIKSIL